MQESDNLWWDAFATEFFEDDASLTLTFCLEDGPKRYSKYTDFEKIEDSRRDCSITKLYLSPLSFTFPFIIYFSIHYLPSSHFLSSHSLFLSPPHHIRSVLVVMHCADGQCVARSWYFK